MSIVDVNNRIDFESRVFHPARERLVLTPIPLPVHQHGQTFFEAEPAAFGIFYLTANGFDHLFHATGRAVGHFLRRIV